MVREVVVEAVPERDVAEQRELLRDGREGGFDDLRGVPELRRRPSAVLLRPGIVVPVLGPEVGEPAGVSRWQTRDEVLAVDVAE